MRDSASNSLCSSLYVEDYHGIQDRIVCCNSWSGAQFLAIYIQEYTSRRRGRSSIISASWIYGLTLVDLEYRANYTQTIDKLWTLYNKRGMTKFERNLQLEASNKYRPYKIRQLYCIYMINKFYVYPGQKEEQMNIFWNKVGSGFYC